MAESLRNGHFWKEDETELMLTLLKELNILKYMDGRKTRNGDLFKNVAEQLREGGFTRTPEQIRIRWKHLKKTYYLASKNKTTSGRDRVVCPFGDALEELLGPQVHHHGVDVGFESALDTPVQDTSVLEDEIAVDGSTGSTEEAETDTPSRPQTPHLPGTSQRPPGRRRNVAIIDTVLERMDRMEAAWMLQTQQSQEREERMVNSILDSNERMLSAIMEGIRGFSNSTKTSMLEVYRKEEV